MIAPFAIEATCPFAFIRACLLYPAVDSIKKIGNNNTIDFEIGEHDRHIV